MIPSRLNNTKDKLVKHVTLLGGLFCSYFSLLWILTKIRTYSVSNILSSSAPIPLRRITSHEDKYIFRNIWKPWREGWSGHSSQGKTRMWHLQGCCLHSILWRGDRDSFCAFVTGRLKEQLQAGDFEEDSRPSHLIPGKGAGLEAIYILVRSNSRKGITPRLGNKASRL